MIGNSENIRVRRNSKLVSKNREEYDPCIHGPGVDNCGHPDCTGTPKKRHYGQHGPDCFGCKIQSINVNKANLH